MHLLKHSWASERKDEEDSSESWPTAVLTLAESVNVREKDPSTRIMDFLVPHIESCLRCHWGVLFTTDYGEYERLLIAAQFARFYRDNLQPRVSTELIEHSLKGNVRVIREREYEKLKMAQQLAAIYITFDEIVIAIELLDLVIEVQMACLGDRHRDTLLSMYLISQCCSKAGLQQGAEH